MKNKYIKLCSHQITWHQPFISIACNFLFSLVFFWFNERHFCFSREENQEKVSNSVKCPLRQKSTILFFSKSSWFWSFLWWIQKDVEGRYNLKCAVFTIWQKIKLNSPLLLKRIKRDSNNLTHFDTRIFSLNFEISM